MIAPVVFVLALSLSAAPALAQESNSAMQQSFPSIAHLAITFLGLVVAARLAWQAFGRAVTVAEVPTFPRYMTSRQQYRLGSLAFVLFSCSFFLLLILDNRDVLALPPVAEVIPESIIKAAQDQSPSYLAIVAAVGAIYLYLLTVESEWNVLLIMRDVIHSWISVPQLAQQIIAQIQFSLRIPPTVILQVVATSPTLAEQDFRKEASTPDRMWAEICYARWWVTQGHDAGEDATFFADKSFGFDKLMEEFQQASWTMARWKSGSPTDVVAFAQSIKQLHSRFARLVACYLIYRNDSRSDLAKEADGFGIEIYSQVPVNPLRYWIVYISALVGSVYVGVFLSSVAYDYIYAGALVFAQSADRFLAWVMYSLSNYGLAIAVVLCVRYISSQGGGIAQSHLVLYCWSFFAAFVVGPLGLTLAVHFFGQGELPNLPLATLYYKMLQWGLGPALVTVYISYYLDRQICPDLPDVDSSAATVGWRLLNCLSFALGVVFLLLPSLLSLSAPEGATWDSAKLRFVASGTTFCIAFGLAVAAQFALKKEVSKTEPVSPSGRGGMQPQSIG